MRSAGAGDTEYATTLLCSAESAAGVYMLPISRVIDRTSSWPRAIPELLGPRCE